MSYIEANGTFTFDGIKSSDYGVWINGSGTYNAPARRYKEYVVPGQNGTLTIDEGSFDEMDLVYPAFIKEGFENNLTEFRNLLASKSGYLRLEDSYHPDEFYLAKFMSGLEVEPAPGGVAGSFNLKFRRDPRRFLKSGEDEITIRYGSGTITNPTLHNCLPFMRVTCSSGTVTINSDTITIASQGSETYVDIDSEIQDCYRDTENRNARVTFQSGKFPVLKPGENSIAYSSGVSNVKIIPRWYIL